MKIRNMEKIHLVLFEINAECFFLLENLLLSFCFILFWLFVNLFIYLFIIYLFIIIFFLFVFYFLIISSATPSAN